MTQHEQKPESAALERVKAYIRARKEKPIRQMGDGIHEVHPGDGYDACLTVPDLIAVADMADQRRKDDEKRELISANLDRPGLIEWSVHILGPDDVHSCGTRADAEALADETNILAGSTNKGRSDDEFVTYAAYVVPRFRADHETEQRRKDAEGGEPVAWLIEDRGKGDPRHAHTPDRAVTDKAHADKAARFNFKVSALYPGPANVAALIAEAVAAEREKIANKLDEVAKHLARPWGSYLTEEGIAVKEACAARVEQEAVAIRAKQDAKPKNSPLAEVADVPKYTTLMKFLMSDVNAGTEHAPMARFEEFFTSDREWTIEETKNVLAGYGFDSKVIEADYPEEFQFKPVDRACLKSLSLSETYAADGWVLVSAWDGEDGITIRFVRPASWKAHE